MNPQARPAGVLSDKSHAVFADGGAPSIEASFALCEKLARSHYENFSIATHLLPGDLRRHFYSVYAFCRGVDDLGDEFAGDRLAALGEWESQLRLCYSGAASHPYFVALQETVSQFGIPVAPFLKLIEANRRDQQVKRHADYTALLDYCDHSANPVGRIVLLLFGHRDEELHALSDYICTALQLANFWQDVRRDYESGRVYIPQRDMDEFCVAEDVIARGEATPEFRRLVKFEVDRTRELFSKGFPLTRLVQKRARLDLALFTAGGLDVLRAIERQRYDVLTHRPEVSTGRKLRLLASAWLRTKLGMLPLARPVFR